MAPTIRDSAAYAKRENGHHHDGDEGERRDRAKRLVARDRERDAGDAREPHDEVRDGDVAIEDPIEDACLRRSRRSWLRAVRVQDPVMLPPSA
jgi:hypothetical protein